MPKFQRITRFRAELTKAEKDELFYNIHELCKHGYNDKNCIELKKEAIKMIEDKIVKHINGILLDVVNRITTELQDN